MRADAPRRAAAQAPFRPWVTKSQKAKRVRPVTRSRMSSPRPVPLPIADWFDPGQAAACSTWLYKALDLTTMEGEMPAFLESRERLINDVKAVLADTENLLEAVGTESKEKLEGVRPRLEAAMLRARGRVTELEAQPLEDGWRGRGRRCRARRNRWRAARQALSRADIPRRCSWSETERKAGRPSLATGREEAEFRT
jgi:hypothetical protein